MRTNFERRTAVLISLVSVILVSITSPIAWYVATEEAESAIVSLANEETERLLAYYHVLDFSNEISREGAQQAADILAGGFFDIAELYGASGEKLAEAMTPSGAKVEDQLTKHAMPVYMESSYESMKLPDGDWVLRVFVPLHFVKSGSESLAGYFEGVRIVPDWQRRQITTTAFTAALMVALASLICGAVLYPIVVYLSKENRRRAKEVLDSHISMMEALGRSIAKRDSDTGVHNYRVAWVATKIAEAIEIPKDSMQPLIIGSFLHDVGKIAIPDSILLKPGRLTDDEMELMRTHVDQGESILKGIGWLDDASTVVACHHEKWNGTGYPRGLKAESIPLAARVFAVADVFDALCSKRPYKEPMSFEQSMSILIRDSGSHFDPDIVKVFEGIALGVYKRLDGIAENEAKALLQERVNYYFGL
ncbi:HD domain-containing protein [Amphritea atlantica]|uniref:HD domain-containing protein n=1 Tax=Amphritea atlantica TaxID=355243 RepID=A0A1H9DHS4_9GAMM|nr:HD domain-containing protein [Amphritea atlantica]